MTNEEYQENENDNEIEKLREENSSTTKKNELNTKDDGKCSPGCNII